MLKITNQVNIPDDEIEISAIRAQGPGGQKINKIASAIHLRFDIRASSLPEFYKNRLLKIKDKRITKDGVIIIKAQESRSQEKNKKEAISRLIELIRSATTVRKKRIPTRPTAVSRQKRLERKSRHSQLKSLRKKIINVGE